MKEDERLELSQIPDFGSGRMEFGRLPAEDDSHPEDAVDGIIERPFIPLRDLVLYPRMVMPLFVGREKSLAAIQAAAALEQNIIVAAQIDASDAEPEKEEIYSFGTEAQLGRALRMPDTSSSVLSQGVRRVEIVEFTQWEPYIKVKVRLLDESTEDESTTEALMRAVRALFEKVVELNRKLPEEAYTFALNIDSPGWLADFVTSSMPLDVEKRQEILETLDTTTRLQQVSVLLAKELDVLEMEDDIHSRVQQEVDKNQREYFLREQMRVIQSELGEGDVFTQELGELRESLAAKELPELVRERAEKELSRLSSMAPMAPEVGVIRTYLDWLLELPWKERSDDRLDIAIAAEVLEADHYGLKKAKERILEFMAVRKIAPTETRTPILCFVGPPGTGKTSIGRSIARALNREFVRVSLGGIRDEAEIRGHRRTYVGALPGRIIQSVRRAGTGNPLLMLDEIDKLGQDFRGDPSSALLEVLDPEQNKAFSDHYIDLDFDLSQVLFLTTANLLDTIPPALHDRLEVIEFPGYIEEEKLEIARRFLIPRQLKEHGLESRGIRFESGAIQSIIRQYTYEAGVRNLDRSFAGVCRKIARLVAENKRYPKRISAAMIAKLLGPAPAIPDMMHDAPEIGVSTGLAWTSAGGDTIFIEVSLLPGKGSVTLTGQLGEVMQESAQAALSYTRSRAAEFGMAEDYFENTDIHMHIPEGAVPKDGPSAGVAMATALISACTNRPVRHDVGMTGEITLRGRVLAVGGIREKALAARRAGLKTLIMPRKNKGDLEEIPRRLRKSLNIVLIDSADEAIEFALLEPEAGS